MSSPDPKSSRRINPATADREALLAHLGTDPDAGLSPGEAERRRLSRRAAPLYGTAIPRVSDHIKRLLRDPVLWLLLAVSVIALFFDRIPLGLLCLLLTAGHTTLCICLDRRAARVDAAMQRLDAPLSRVLRGGRVLRLGEAGLVRGDILLLYPGDMVPADCRLLDTRDFAVSERPIDATDPDRPAIRLEKNAATTPEDPRAGQLSPPNMAYAGGTVESGYARAVVIATGGLSHLGGLVGSVSPAHARRTPAFHAAAGKYLSYYNLMGVAFIIPAVVLGFLTLSDRYEPLDIFLSVIALVGVTLAEHLMARARYLSAALRREAATDRDASSTADIKSSVEPEKLLSMTDLFLVGTAALHDGVARPVALVTGESTYRMDTPEADEEATAAAELLYIYHHITSTLARPTEPQDHPPLTAAVAALAPAVADWAGLDTDAPALRLQELRVAGDTASGIIPTADGNRRLHLRVCADLDPALPAAETYREAYEEARRTGLRTLVLIADGAIAALLSYTLGVSPKTAGIIRSLEDAGIRVRAFLRTSTPEDVRILHTCGLLPGETARLACSNADILSAMDECREAGGTVAVLSVDRVDIPLLHAADLAISVAPSFFLSAEEGLPRQEHHTSDSLAAPDGTPDSPMATDLCRRRADILVRRTSPEGGGVGGVRRALLAADRIKSATDRAFGFLLLSQAARLIFAILAMALGLTPLSGPLFLFSGLCVDTFVVLASTHLPGRDVPAPRRRMESGIIPPWRTYRARLIALAMASVLPWLIAHVANVMGVPFGADLSTYGLLSLMGLQLAIFRTGLGRTERRSRAALLITLVLAFCYMGALAVALGAGLALLWALVLPLIPALVSVLFKLIFERILPPAA